jgi:hypothetical protein
MYQHNMPYMPRSTNTAITMRVDVAACAPTSAYSQASGIR